jgi:mannose-6-phosphate isomerase
MLYPLKFNPIYKDKIWGGQKINTVLKKDFRNLKNCGESWEISGVDGDVSVVSNGLLAGNTLNELVEIYMSELVGEKVYEKFGIEFPLLIKYIDASDKLSIQVHPDDELAHERHNAYGKTEMWYIIQADKGAELISGFTKTIDQKVYLKHLENKSLKDILNFEKVKPGDVFFIPAGRVHAIGEGILLAEIQQTSDVTYRIYDWDRLDDKGNPRELHTDLALGAICYDGKEEFRREFKPLLNQTMNIADCKYFETNVLEFNQSIEKSYIDQDSFVIYMCLEGSFILNVTGCEKTKIEMGETVLIPASIDEVSLIPNEKSKILEVYVPNPEIYPKS